MLIELSDDEADALIGVLTEWIQGDYSDDAEMAERVEAARDRIAALQLSEPKPDPVAAKAIAAARERYASDELEIDDEPKTSRVEREDAGTAGTWVAAWVWVEDDEQELPCGHVAAPDEDGWCPKCQADAEAGDA